VTIAAVRSGSFALPAIGFGTVALNGAAGVIAVRSALDNGYRLIDSAFSYENEGAVGVAVRSSGVSREDILVTSKLPGRHHRYDNAIRTVEESLFRTGLDYLDLYLVHWPNPRQGLYVEAWTALAAARERGLVRAIGVSNFLPEHIEHLRAETGLLPAVNQIEMHPYLPQHEQRAHHAANGIITEAWTPIGHSAGLLSDATIVRIAREHGVSPAQVVLRWHVQLGVVPLPKASTPDHQRQNLDVFGFGLSEAQVNEISGLARSDGRTAGQDPTTYEEF
jgi:diketogulonate reductase-like aldo/keto reductase